LVGAVGRFLGVVEDAEELVEFELLVELPEVEFPVGVGPITVVKTCETTTVVVCLPCPRPTEVERMVVTTVLEPPDESVLGELPLVD
jgi:hypothetical protein